MTETDSQCNLINTTVKKILILSANPKRTPQRRLDEEVREIEEGLRLAKHRDQFEIKAKWAVRLKDLRRALLDYEPHIIHFMGHGRENGLLLEGEKGTATPISSKALGGLFKLFSAQVECVVLNACYSECQANAINKHIKYVIGMRGEIKNKAAIEFAVGFYDALGAGWSVEKAFKLGINAIQQMFPDLPEHLSPILRRKKGLRKQARTPVTSIRSKEVQLFPDFNSIQGNTNQCSQVSILKIKEKKVTINVNRNHPVKRMENSADKIWSALRRNAESIPQKPLKDKLQKGVFLLFQGLLVEIARIRETYEWKNNLYPYYSIDYETLLSSYLYFFQEQKLPASLLKVVANEFGALLIGLAMEISVLSSGTGDPVQSIVALLKKQTHGFFAGFQLNDSFWDMLLLILEKSGSDEASHEFSLNFNDNENRINVIIDNIPYGEMRELLQVVGFLSLIRTTSAPGDSSFGEMHRLRLLIQANIKKLNVDNEKIYLHFSPIARKDFESLVRLFANWVKIEGEAQLNDDIGTVKSKWIEIEAGILKGRVTPMADSESFDVCAYLKEKADFYIGKFLNLRSVFEYDLKKLIKLPLDEEIRKFLLSDKNGFFAIGLSGSGKTSALRSLLNADKINDQHLYIPISPKFASFQKSGINLFFSEISSHLKFNDKKKLLKHINDLLHLKKKKLVLILDGLNEIKGSQRELIRQYEEILDLADKINDLHCDRIKLIITCRDNAFIHYRDESSQTPNPKSFYCPYIKDDKDDPYYQIDPLDWEKQKELIGVYFNDDIGSLFLHNLAANKMLAKSFSHPYLLAVAGSVLNSRHDLEDLSSTSRIFEKFVKNMLERCIGTKFDIHGIKKIIFAYFTVVLSSPNREMPVSQFCLVDCLDNNDVENAYKILHSLKDVNIFNNSSPGETDYIRFSHDRIEEYFLGEYLFEFSIKAGVMEKVFEFATADLVFKGGIQLFFNKVVKLRDSSSHNQTYPLRQFWKIIRSFYVHHKINASTCLVEAISCSEKINMFFKHFLIEISRKTQDDSLVKFIEIVISGLRGVFQNYVVFDVKKIVQALFQLIEDYPFLSRYRAHLYYILAKYEKSEHDNKSALDFAEKALEFIPDGQTELADSINLLIATLIRNDNVTDAICKMKQVFSNQIKVESWEQAVNTALELGAALRDDTKFEEALEIYDCLPEKAIAQDAYASAKLNLQKGIIYKNMMQRILHDRAKVHKYSPKKKVLKLFEKSMRFYNTALEWAEKNNSVILLLEILSEISECCVKASEVDRKRLEDFEFHIKSFERYLSYFPVPARMVECQRIKALYYESWGDIDRAIDFIKKGRDIAKDAELTFKMTDCYYHLGHLVYRTFEKRKTREYLEMGIEALSNAINLYKQLASGKNEYLLSCIEAREKLLEKREQILAHR